MTPSEDWIRLSDLRPGAVFRTKDGILAVKSDIGSFIGLIDGSEPFLIDGDEILVKEIIIRAPSTHDGPIIHPLDYALVVFDLDGTIRRCRKHRGPCHNAESLWELISDVPDIFAQYEWGEVGFGTASNQGGVGLGFLGLDIVWNEEAKTLDLAFAKTRWMANIYSWTDLLSFIKGGMHFIEFAPASPYASSPYRKPSPYMLLRIVDAWGARLDRTLFVGDSPEDQQAAERAGVAFCWAWQFFDRREDAPYLARDEMM